MMKINVFQALMSILLLTSCAARVTSTIHQTHLPLSDEEKVIVFGLHEEVPPNAEKLGTVRVGDSGLTIRCDFVTVLAKAKTEARKVGGNVLSITEHRIPDFWSTCHRITTEVFRMEGIERYVDAARTADTDDALIDAIVYDFPRFRFAMDGGWQRRTARLADGMDASMRQHYRNMLSGFHGDIRAAYFFDERNGIELMFSRQMFGNSPSGTVTFTNDDISISGRLNHRTSFDYIGVNYVIRLFDSQRKNSWLFSAGLGYMGYNSRMNFDGTERLRMTASTLGSTLGIGYDIGISDSFGIGFKLSVISGTFRNFRHTIDGVTASGTMPDGEFEGLGTIRLSVGIRF